MKQEKRMGKRLLASVMSAALLTSTAAVQLSAQPIMTASAADHNYAEALELSLYFFDANQCGSEVDDNCLTWRGNCHTYDATASLNSAEGLSAASISAIKAQNGGSDTVDVSGGYHDAGDHIKFSMTMGFAATSLAWSYFSYPEAYDDSGCTDHLLYILRETCDYFMKVTYLDDNDDFIAACGQVASEGEDHSVWSAPEGQTMNRTTYWMDASNPMADAAGQMASTLASSSLAFRNNGDAAYADECLKYAQALQEFAAKYPSTKNLGRGNMYQSTSQVDDVAWAEVWVKLAENNGTLPSSYTPSYVLTGDKCYTGNNYDGYMYCWDKVWSGYAALLAEVGYDTSKYTNEMKTELNGQGGLTNSKYNAAGWGASRYNCALQMLALHIADASNDDSYAEAAKFQMDYILGNNTFGYSFLSGYGTAWPTHIHHRAANPGTGDANANTACTYTLYGGLIGGPDSSGNYEDNQNSYQFTEPALDYNGCFALAIAGLASRYGGDATAADEVAAAASEITAPFDFGGGTTIITPTEPDPAEPTSDSEDDTTEATTEEIEPTTEETEPTTETPSTGGSNANVEDMGGNVWKIDVTGADKVTITVKTDVNSGANGCVGYSSASSDWNQTDWTTTADGEGYLVYEFEIPEGVTSIQYQVWWPSNVTFISAVLSGGSIAETTEPEDTEPTSAPGEVNYGDVNCDGDVTILDVIKLNKNLLSGESLDAQGQKNADVDGDDKPTVTDSMNILKYVIKMIDTLPVA